MPLHSSIHHGLAWHAHGGVAGGAGSGGEKPMQAEPPVKALLLFVFYLKA